MDRFDRPDLSGRVCVVTGASYGVGRGIAEVLGQCGATVYVSARSTRARPSGDHGWSVEETAELVDAGGGTGIAVRCDHFSPAQTARLFARVRRERGRLDLLVNNVFLWGGGNDSMRAPTWEQTVESWDAMMGSVRAQFLSARAAIPLMLEAGRGLIVGTSTKRYARRPDFLTTARYDVSAVALDRLHAYLANELRPWGVTAMTVYPGWPRTVNMPVPTSKAAKRRFVRDTESPLFAGRAIAHLAADAMVALLAGKALTSADAARRYGFTDVDGRVPDPSW